MELDFLNPVSISLQDEIKQLEPQSIGAHVQLHTQENGLPNLDTIHIAIFGISENRLALRKNSSPQFDELRKAIYQLYPGNWHLQMADLGDIINRYLIFYEVFFSRYCIFVSPVIHSLHKIPNDLGYQCICMTAHPVLVFIDSKRSYFITYTRIA